MRGREIFDEFTRSGQAHGAFNVFNAETVRGVVAGVVNADGRAYIQTSASTVKSYGARVLASLIFAFVGETERHRFVLHLDHCLDLELIALCLREGWDSVMIDASSFPLDENIRRTREVVQLAHANGAIAEGEIGAVGEPEDGFEAADANADPGAESRVSPDEIQRFAEETAVDLLAVGVGTQHGFYREGRCEVDVALLGAASRLCPGVPLVLHGGSGIPLAQVSASVAAGVRKINISTELKEAYLVACRAHCESADPYAVLKGVDGATAAVRDVVTGKVEAFRAMPTSPGN